MEAALPVDGGGGGGARRQSTSSFHVDGGNSLRYNSDRHTCTCIARVKTNSSELQ